MSSNERIVFGHPRGLGPRGSHHENMGSIPIARSVWKKEQWMRVMVIYGMVNSFTSHSFFGGSRSRNGWTQLRKQTFVG